MPLQKHYFRSLIARVNSFDICLLQAKTDAFDAPLSLRLCILKIKRLI